MKNVSHTLGLRVDIGRADVGGTFVRVVHLPTGQSRTKVGLDGRTAQDVADDLATELLRDIAAEGKGVEPS